MTGSASYAYQGAASPGDGAHPFNAQAFFVQRMLNQRHTATVVRVVGTSKIVTYGSPEPIQTIDILPLVNEVTGADQPVPHAVVYGVPYFRLQGGRNAVIVDPVVGDTGIFVVAETDISSALKTGQQSNPGSDRRNNYSDGMYIGCISAAAPNQYVAFTSTGITIVDKNGNIITMGPGGITLTAASGGSIVQTAGGTPAAVETAAGASPVAKADG